MASAGGFVSVLRIFLIFFAASAVAWNASASDALSKSSVAQESVDQLAADIIRRADRVRAPSEPFKYSLMLVEMNGEREVSRQGFEVFMRFYKPDANGVGDARALVRFVDPPADKGKSLLAVFEKLWYYEPKLRRPIAISRQQRLVGQVSNGDVVATDYDLSYTSRLGGEERCGDLDCYRLNLERREAYVTYPKITYWVEKNSYRPHKAEFLSVSGKLIKRAWYKDYREADGVQRPHEIVIEDSLRKAQYTRMLYSDLRLEELPEAYFQKEYLMRLR